MTHPRTSPATPGADTADDPLTDPGTGTAGRPGTGTTADVTPATGTPATGAPATGAPATGTSATGTSATGTSATGAPATGSATGGSATGGASAGAAPAAGTTEAHPGTATLATATPAELRDHLTALLDEPARGWLRRALDEAAAHPGTHGPISVWELRIAEAGRRCGPVHADAARVLILHAARADAEALARVYYQGTGAERRAVLYALPHLVPGREGLPLVEDALRTNDTRLLTAAVGPYAARYLDTHAWRHAVLKCLFTGVPVDAVADLDRRAHRDTELARMLTDYAAERTAAGRPVPADLHRVLTLTDPPATPSAPAADHG